MFSLARSTRAIPMAPQLYARRKLSTYGPMDADVGKLGTSVHHAMTVGLAIFTPFIFVVPDSYTDGIVNKTFGVLLSVNIAAHSWIGMNYVCRDYVPKISYKLLGPAKVFNAGMALITLIGMSKICLTSPGGLKGVVKALWVAEPKKKEAEF